MLSNFKAVEGIHAVTQPHFRLRYPMTLSSAPNPVVQGRGGRGGAWNGAGVGEGNVEYWEMGKV